MEFWCRVSNGRQSEDLEKILQTARLEIFKSASSKSTAYLSKVAIIVCAVFAQAQVSLMHMAHRQIQKRQK